MLKSWDDRRDFIVPGNEEQTIAFAAEHWIHTAQRAIQQRGRFAVALSGGSTPKAIYRTLAAKYAAAIDWKLVHLFWSDERCVAPNHPDSNYKMAMESGFSKLPILPTQIHRLKGETRPELAARDYDDLIRKNLGSSLFDLVMLGLGEDGHTASLFPHTAALAENNSLAAPNFLPQTEKHRLTLTFPCINKSHLATLYVIGPSKQAVAPLVLNAAIQSSFPASAIGTPEHKALWILDQSAASLLGRPQ